MNNTQSKVYSVSEANKMLPYVRSISKDIQDCWSEIINKRTQLEEIEKAKLDTKSCKDDLNMLIDRINGYIKEIEDLGCYAQEFKRGIIVWPSLRNGSKVFLCWALEDKSISFWHELDETFKDRRPFSGVMME